MTISVVIEQSLSEPYRWAAYEHDLNYRSDNHYEHPVDLGGTAVLLGRSKIGFSTENAARASAETIFNNALIRWEIGSRS